MVNASDIIQLCILAVGIVAICVTIRISITQKNEQERSSVNESLSTIGNRMASMEAILKGIPELWTKVNKHGEEIAALRTQLRTPRRSRFEEDEET